MDETQLTTQKVLDRNHEQDQQAADQGAQSKLYVEQKKTEENLEDQAHPNDILWTNTIIRPTASVSFATLLVLQIVYPLIDCIEYLVVLKFENK